MMMILCINNPSDAPSLQPKAFLRRVAGFSIPPVAGWRLYFVIGLPKASAEERTCLIIVQKCLSLLDLSFQNCIKASPYLLFSFAGFQIGVLTVL